jgi:hypothetical protein
MSTFYPEPLFSGAYRTPFGILDDATLTGFNTEGSLMFSHNKVVNKVSEEGATKTVVSA